MAGRWWADGGQMVGTSLLSSLFYEPSYRRESTAYRRRTKSAINYVHLLISGQLNNNRSALNNGNTRHLANEYGQPSSYL